MVTQIVARSGNAVIIVLRNYDLAVKFGLTCKQCVKHRLCELVNTLCTRYHIRIGIALGESVKLFWQALLSRFRHYTEFLLDSVISIRCNVFS